MTNDVSETIIKLEGIVKTFPGIVAVDFGPDDQLQFRYGEIHALAGENGAGKSTLVTLIAGIQPLTEGRMWLEGKTYIPSNVLHARDVGVEIVLQESGLIKKMNVADNLFLGREYLYKQYGFLNPREKYRLAEKALSGIAEEIPPSASAGTLDLEQQKFVELARALFFNPKVLIIDEMTAGLSDSGVNKLFQILRDLRAKGRLIIYISHYLDEVFDLCDRVTIMKDGKLVKTLSTNETDEDKISTLMVGRATRAQMFEQERAGAARSDVVMSIEGLGVEGKFKNINFKLHRGEIVGVGGLLGCGNEDLALALFGLLKPDKGKILVRGKEITFNNPRTSIREKIGYLPKDRDNEGLILRLQLKDNITLPSLPWLSKSGFTHGGQAFRIAGRLVEELDIACRSVNDYPINLSGGNRQKVVLAKWMVRENEILIMNNPTRGIDVGAKSDVYRMMRDMAHKGVGMILVSQELPELLGMCDRILIMRQGEISAEFAEKPLPTEEQLITYML